MQTQPQAPARKPGWLARLAAITPGPRAWRGAAAGALLTTLLIVALYLVFLTAAGGLWITLTSTAAALALVVLAGSLLFGLAGLAARLPRFYRYALSVALFCLVLAGLLSYSVLYGVLAFFALLLLAGSLIGAGLWVLLRGGQRGLTRAQRIVLRAGLGLGGLILTASLVFLLIPGFPVKIPFNISAANARQVAPLELPDPARPGLLSVARLTYGSGTDLRRPEFGAQAALVTQSVDGSSMAKIWSPLRAAYWGFGIQELPLNGRVWYPVGKGPFPLVVAVHGNHPMEDYSDLGYAYLGELLASRGYIFVSVDQNFLNISAWGDMLFFNRLDKESGLRGWLLLEHLKAWREWNAAPGNPFYGQVDLDRIALIGHSRGGEAIGIAAAYNRLSRNPDDASQAFDYNFGIRSLAALAPVDGQYKPSGVSTPLEDVNYLVLHGAHDGDVITFQGKAPYHRLRFSGSDFYFKSAVYIYGANHGQFNTDWRNKDLAEPVPRLFNLGTLMPIDQQTRIAEVLVSAFLDTTLKTGSNYLGLFQDLRSGMAWLPPTIYLNEYADSDTLVVSHYEEDIDLATTSLAGGFQRGENLTRWQEGLVKTKNGTSANKAVTLGWHPQQEGLASYTIGLPVEAVGSTANSVLVFSLADAGLDPLPDSLRSGDKPDKQAEPPAAIDLTIEVFDRQGNTARLPLSRFSMLQPQLEGRVAKLAFMHTVARSEPVFQTFAFPLVWFAESDPDFDPAALAGLRLVFNRTESGAVLLDNVSLRGLRQP